jgi:hypothetical protein
MLVSNKGSAVLYFWDFECHLRSHLGNFLSLEISVLRLEVARIGPFLKEYKKPLLMCGKSTRRLSNSLKSTNKFETQAFKLAVYSRSLLSSKGDNSPATKPLDNQSVERS